MSRRALIAGLFFLAACGGARGTNTASGTAKGVTFESGDVYAIYNIKGNIIVQDSLSVLVSNDPKACEHLHYSSDKTEQPYLVLDDGSHAPSIWFKTTAHSDILTTMRGIGDDMYARLDPGAAAGTECADAACEGRWIIASKGTMEINASSNPSSPDAWAAGTYYMTFGGEQLSGEFNATACQGMTVGGCSTAGGGSAIPALGLIALALLKRRRAARA